MSDFENQDKSNRYRKINQSIFCKANLTKIIESKSISISIIYNLFKVKH